MYLLQRWTCQSIKECPATAFAACVKNDSVGPWRPRLPRQAAQESQTRVHQLDGIKSHSCFGQQSQGFAAVEKSGWVVHSSVK